MNAPNSDHPDRIEKQILLHAPRSKVWRALTDTREFNQWFGVRLAGTFAPGKTVSGPVTHEGYQDKTMVVTVERMEPERFFSWRWHPGGCGPQFDSHDDPTTLVEFELEDAPGGTLLKIVETGFSRIPLARQAEAYRGNTEGWAFQAEALDRYVRQAA